MKRGGGNDTNLSNKNISLNMIVVKNQKEKKNLNSCVSRCTIIIVIKVQFQASYRFSVNKMLDKCPT